MAASSSLIAALVRKVNKMEEETEGSGRAWLEGIQDSALTASLAGDVEVTSLSFEGGSHTSKRGINADDLLDACESALLILDEEDESGPIIPQFSGLPR